MKNKIAFVLLASLFLIDAFGIFSYAVEKEPLNRYEGETHFQSVSATGSQQTGNVGYLSLMGYDAFGTATIQYYLWVREDGSLMIASYPAVSAFSSFPSGDWRGTGTFGFKAGVKVGSQ